MYLIDNKVSKQYILWIHNKVFLILQIIVIVIMLVKTVGCYVTAIDEGINCNAFSVSLPILVK